MLKCVHWHRNLRVRNLNAMAKIRSSRSGPLTLRFLTGLVHALANVPSSTLKTAGVAMISF
ncbi:hypothetical protein FGZ69_05730 [Lacticaseibacillus paracasei]|uniref:Uncharacterized protein n=1 Tax=Lacticaseibacillus paracasei TaxID=1597 RepID=A0AB38QAR4_LACPA|nr:hypothetical protein CYL78_00440 [Lacticaseibacillus paracasei subsp. tolerans]MCS6148991.1 hypothetical protein [Lacticaseibacillus paracasei]MCT3320345.1 hypothetical protein [Lacticaseibacillus paracasei]MCT3356686.1 hypothetical protein [Lacticaseibacillus paracasei]MCT3365141.1 hypothetical protein [Lacticaseibacillus paracasei]